MLINFKELRKRLDIHKLMGLDKNVKVTQCHFHDDKTPSMAVSSVYNTYRCFACGEHGDAIDYYAKRNSLSNYEAATELAEMVGYDLGESKRSPEEAARYARQKKFVEGLEEKHVSYLKNRGIEDIGIKTYKLGAVEDYITQPIFDDKGRLVGHNKRLMGPRHGEKIPFLLDEGSKKSKYLGGMNVAKGKPGPLILTESYFDIIQAYQEGLNAVCVFGAELSNEQADIACKYFSDFVLAFDRDEKGIPGAIKAFKLLKKKCKLATVRFAACDDLGDYLYENDELETINFYEFATDLNLGFSELMRIIKYDMGVIERRQNLLAIATETGCSLEEMYRELSHI